MLYTVKQPNGAHQAFIRWARAVTVMLVAALSGAATTAHAANDLKPVRIALSLSPLSSPFIVALEKGYFSEFGLAPTVTKVVGGYRAANALFSGEVDIATTAETVVMFNSFKGLNFGIFSTFVRSDNDVKLMARKDAKIQTLADLAGHRVGTTKGSSAQFFLDYTLMMNQVPRAGMEFVHVAPEDAISALKKGDVDAIAAWEPIGRRTKIALGDAVVEVPHDRFYIETFNAIAMKAFAKNNGETLDNVLRALIKAEEFISNNGKEAQGIVSAYLKMDPKLLAAIWPDFVFTITLDQSLITSLEAEARWAIRESLVDAKDIPNYLNVLLPESLERVRPQSVTVFQ